MHVIGLARTGIGVRVTLSYLAILTLNSMPRSPSQSSSQSSSHKPPKRAKLSQDAPPSTQKLKTVKLGASKPSGASRAFDPLTAVSCVATSRRAENDCIYVLQVQPGQL